MDLLKRDLAPISSNAWEEIDTLARETLTASLTARKFVDVSGPHGVNHTSVNIGRLDIPKNQKSGGVLYGIHSTQPLIESRVRFSLPRWELDNIERGAEDAELDSLVKAAKQAAAFEEEAVFSGLKQAGITGLSELTTKSSISISLDNDSITDGVSEAQTKLIQEGIDSPAYLVAGPELWKQLSRSAPGGSLRNQVEKQIDGKVIYSPSIKGGLIISARGGDFELNIGQDFSIGYHSHTTEEVELFIMESFTFRIITPEAAVGLSLA